MYTLGQIVDELNIEDTVYGTGASDVVKGWLSEILGDRKQVDEFHHWTKDNEKSTVYKVLALTGKRVWTISIDVKNRDYTSSSFLTGDISVLQLENKGGRVTLKIGVGEHPQEVSATRDDDKRRLISLHRQLAIP